MDGQTYTVSGTYTSVTGCSTEILSDDHAEHGNTTTIGDPLYTR